MLEWLKSHTNVVYQPKVTDKGYSGFNPYALGFAMYTDIKRICEAPTDEDRQWFPDIAGSDWRPPCTRPCATSRTRASSVST
jgi:stage V sporulation protein R